MSTMTAVHMSQVIVPSAFTVLPVDGDKQTIITTLIDQLVSAKKVKPTQVSELVSEAMKREALSSTGIGNGIAIPHCRTTLIKDMACAFGRCSDGLDFGSLDGEPVYSVFFLLTPAERKEDHLSLMKSFASLIRKEHFCEFLHQVDSTKTLIDLLAEFEAK
jgi:mannitol/fructose-specific phosphotransferase system IIA component (Ntr-type)